MKINGTIHHLHCRKFCLQCSPFKTHNTKNLINKEYKQVYIEKDGIKYKLCPECEQYLEINSENYYITNSGKFHHYCKPCGKKRASKSQKNMKLKSIEYLGGKCSICGYSKYYGSLDCHHKDPTKKDFSISDGRCYDFEKLKLELNKCILVCRNCHGEIHGGIITI
jgi:hypothetical protein